MAKENKVRAIELQMVRGRGMKVAHGLEACLVNLLNIVRSAVANRLANPGS